MRSLGTALLQSLFAGVISEAEIILICARAERLEA
jgi:hypothetical protein